jgi:hypothetical protein
MCYTSIPGFEKYEVSSCGQVRRKGKNSPLSPWRHKSGHLYVRIGGKSKQVHHLVMEAHGKPKQEGMECRHLDGNPENNRIENLTWGSRFENIMDFINKNGKHMVTNATSVETAKKIKSEHDGKRGTGKRLAQKYGVSVFTVSEIRTQKTFKYL